MGLLSLFKNKGEQVKHKGSALLAMPMYNNDEGYNIDDLIKHLREYWNTDVKDFIGDKNNFSFAVNNSKIVISNRDLIFLKVIYMLRLYMLITGLMHLKN